MGKKTQSYSYYVNDDMVNQILLRLPTRSLIRFRCVCKSWNSTISSSIFRNRHVTEKTDRLKREDTCFAIMVDCDSDHTYMIMLPHNIHKCPSKILEISSKRIFLDYVCSSNGLLCMSSYDKTQLYLCNPINREILKLPTNNDSQHWSVLGFGLSTSRHSTKYKVLAVAHDDNTLDYNNNLDNIKVCDIPVDGVPTPWRNTGPWPGELRDVLMSPVVGVEVNQKLHWYATNDKAIVSFDLTTDKPQVAPISVNLKEQWPRSKELDSPWVIVLMEFNGRLAFVTEAHDSHSFVIWTTEDYNNNINSSWTMQASFEHRRKIRKGRYVLGWPRYCITINCNSHDNQLLQVCFAGRNMVSYDDKGKRVTFRYSLESSSRSSSSSYNYCFKRDPPIKINQARDCNHWPHYLPFLHNLSPLYGATNIDECQELFADPTLAA